MKGFFYIDMWYGNDSGEADKIDVWFSDCDCVYRGNIWKCGEPIGDYVCSDSTTLETLFPQLVFNWD